MNQQRMMNLESADEHSSELELSPILELNADCLEKVFQYLSLADQICLAQTCTRLRTIYVDFFAAKNKSFNSEITTGLTLWETRDFCQLFGHHVERLSCWRYKNDNFMLCFYAGLYFPNLKMLYVNDKELKVHKLQRILMGTNKLEELMLWTKPSNDRLDLAHLTELKKLEISDWNTEDLSLPNSIEVLILQEWNKFSCLPSILADHTQLKKLQIINCRSNIFKDMAKSQAFASVEVLDLIHRDSYGKELFTQLPKLKKLRLCHIRGSPNLNEHNSQQLDHLEISGYFDIKKWVILEITSLIGLQTLLLSGPREIDDDVITEFGKLKELRRLGLFCSHITERSVLQLLKNCPKLNTLRMEDCYNLTDSLVQSITSLVHCGENQRELPITLQLTRSIANKTKIKSTNPDVAVVYIDLCDDFSDWFEEELKVNI